MKSSRHKSSRHPTKATNGPEKKRNTGLTPSKRHREKLNNVMNELSELLPLPSDVKSSLDRLSVLKLTVSFFQTQNIMKSTEEGKQLHYTNKKEDNKKIYGINVSELALEAVGGFFIVITEDGNVDYVSENVKNHTGYTQTRLMHQEFFSLVHPDDVQGLKTCFVLQPSQKKTFSRKDEEGDLQSSLSDVRQECYCNVRCHAGRLSSHVSPFYYKCFRFYGHLKRVRKSGKSGSQVGFFALCSPISRSVNVTRPIKEHTEKYSCKMDRTMSNLQLHSRGLKILRFTEQDLVGKSAYFFFHPDDLSGMAMVHERIIKESKGSITFRVVKGNGKWQWVRGAAYTTFKDGDIDGMITNNMFVSDEEGVYYKAQYIKEIKEWTAQQSKALTSYPASASSTCSSPPDTCSWSPDTEAKSFQSLSCSSTGFIPSTVNSMALTQTPTLSKSPSNFNNYVLPLPEAVQETYHAVPSKPVWEAASNNEQCIPNTLQNKPSISPHFIMDVLPISGVSGSCQVSENCPADNETISTTMIKELHTSSLDGVGNSVLPCSSSAPSWQSHASSIQGQATRMMPDTLPRDTVGCNAASVDVSATRSGVPIPYPNASTFHYEFDVQRVDETAPLLQDTQPFDGKHMNTDPVYLQPGVVKNNREEVEGNTVSLMNFKEFDSFSERLSEKSFRDFEMLPLMDIERILFSQEGNHCSSTPDSQPPSLEPAFMDSQSDSISQSSERKLKPSNLPATTGFFQTELQGFYGSRDNSSADEVTPLDLEYLTNAHSNGNDLVSQINLIDTKYNGDNFEELIENCKYIDRQTHTNHTTPPYGTSGPINHAESLENLKPETSNLRSIFPNQPMDIS